MASCFSVIPTLRRLWVILCVTAVFAFAQKPVVRIGIILDGPAEQNEKMVSTFQREITALLAEDHDVRFPKTKQLTGDWSAESVKRAVDLLLNDPEVDQVLALGFISSQELAGRESLPKPSYGAFVVDPAAQQIPFETREISAVKTKEEKITVSGVKNLTYVMLTRDLARELEVFRKVAPHTRVTLFYGKAMDEIVPDFAAHLRDHFSSSDVRIEPLAVSMSADETLAALPPDTEAVYVTTLPQLSSSEFDRLVRGLIARKLPSFSQSGITEVKRGILATLNLDETYVRRARRIALDMQQVLSGVSAADLPVKLKRRESLTINMATARAIGLSPSFKILLEADLLNEERTDIHRKLSLSSVVREAENTNLDLAVADRFVASGKQAVKQARSALLPQFGINGGGVFIDSDRARFGVGQSSQHLATGSIYASQLIYSEDVKAAYDAEKTNQKAREQNRAAIRLDVIRDASEAYLNVLRTKTIERVQKENLKLTRSNLELARVRVEIGQAGREEVYRWKSQLSNNNRSVIDTRAALALAEIQLNRVLNHPVEDPFLTTETGVDDPELASGLEQLRPYVETPASFAIYRNFLTAQAMAQSPDVRELENLLRSRKRILKASKRAYYIPKISAGAEGTYLGRYGVGSTQPPPPLNGLWTNPYNWQVSIMGQYDLFNGGLREANLSRAREEVRQYELQLQAVQLRVEQNVRSRLQLANASFAGIDLARDAAEAAHENLKLVSESYSAGVVDILKLLDAQNWALQADLDSASAVYNYLVDLMNVQRATGKFDFFRSPEDRQAFLQQLDEYFQNAGYNVHK